MLLAFPVVEPNKEDLLKSNVSEHFGMAKFFVFVEVGEGKSRYEVRNVFSIEICRKEEGMCTPVQVLFERKPDKVVVKGIGFKAANTLRAGNINILSWGNFSTIEECLNNLDSLDNLSDEDVCMHK